MRKLFILLLFAAIPFESFAQDRWRMSDTDNAIELIPGQAVADHIEMSGEMMSAVLRWGVDGQNAFFCERSLVFPMLRTVPNDTHASLMHRVNVDIPSLLSVNGLSLRFENVQDLWIDGHLGVRSLFSVGRANIGLGTGTAPKPSVELTRRIFPSADKPLLAETYILKNISERNITVYIPEFVQSFRTLPEKGVTGPYIIRSEIDGSGTFVLQPGGELGFSAVFQAYEADKAPLKVDAAAEFEARMALVAGLDASLQLETPDKVLDREFRFAKIRASESIYKTAGGYLHGPGGESYYAAIWANDQAEYVNPFFPYEGYGVGNASALNSYLHFARFMNDAYEPIPSSIIAEGKDIWNGAGDRGDAAMIAHGALRYVMARGDISEARTLWPLIEWCLEYCRRKINDAGVVASDTDELEGRFPAGDANLCTSCLYYDALLSASMLCPEIGVGQPAAKRYKARAKQLAAAIESYFGANVGGFETYRYYEGNDLLRSWICMPLIVGINKRSAGTIAALTSPALMTEDGLLTQQGSETFWDRSTLYSLRGMFIAGETGTALDFLSHYSRRRLLGDHVPYPIEAWPEGSQRHLSAESGLYCRAVIEGMFGLRPTGLRSFTLTPRLSEGWDAMALKHIKAFGSDFDIDVKAADGKTAITVTDNASGAVKRFLVRPGTSVNVKL